MQNVFGRAVNVKIDQSIFLRILLVAAMTLRFEAKIYLSILPGTFTSASAKYLALSQIITRMQCTIIHEWHLYENL